MRENHIWHRLRHLGRRWRAWRYRRLVVRHLLAGAAYRTGVYAVSIVAIVLLHYVRV
ncbi:hypothetical protein [Streptomyces sp. NBC_00893]|uniref:hypothetical protein n=1 Tax=Streptomyces sp. NBC_00893 TaxID=2975862 RepID=UPI002259B2C1|nr:hypothetical protein [Streptomyces sp. NBC_00893]MCX4849867.1 hypothetical protein [Streptomyces sp. NBC_00893]